MFWSILGMYEYDNTIFDGLVMPTYTDPDNITHTPNKTDVINNIMLKCAELELIYPNIALMKLAIETWCNAELDSWNKLYTTQVIEYNPIWNVDADITQQRKINRKITGDDDNTHSVQGFNSSTWAAADKDERDITNEEHTGENFTESRTGNIGVTASQDLIKKEREIASFNIVDYITESFKKRFCLMVY